MADLPTNLTAALSSAPELANTPGYALGLAASGTGTDPTQVAQVGSYAAQQAGLAQGLDEHAANDTTGQGHHGILHSIASFFGGAAHAVAAPIEGALHVLNYPLSVVQHQYRYVHDVFDRHGFIPGLMALAQSYAAPALDFTDGHALHYTDSWDHTADGATYIDSHGNTVSPGRDLGHLVGYLTGGHVANQKGFDAFDAVSGIGDAVFDLGADPTIALGKIKGAVSLGRRLVQISPITGADNIAQVAATNPGVRRAFEDIAGSSAGQIISKYPALRGMAPVLGRTDTPDQVVQAFREALTTNAYMSTRFGLPTTSLTRQHLTYPLAQAVLNAGAKPVTVGDHVVEGYSALGRKVNAVTSYRPYSLDSKTLTLSGHEFDLADDSSVNGVYQALRFSQSQRTAAAIAGKYAQADVAGRYAIYHNSVIDSMRAAGLPEDSPIIARMQADLDATAQAGSTGAVYGVGTDGQNLGRLETSQGNTINAALLTNQTGKVAYPNFQGVRRAMRDAKDGPLGPFWHAYGKFDDWAYQHYTSGFFKPLALLNLGFALRVAMNENVLALGEYGPHNLLAGRATATAAKQGVLGTSEVSPEVAQASIDRLLADPTSTLSKAYSSLGLAPAANEGVHIKAAVAKALYKVSRPDQDMVDVAHMLQIANESHIVNPALSAGDHGVTQMMAPKDAAAFDIHRTIQQIPKGKRLGDAFTVYSWDNANHPLFWQQALREAAGDPGLQKQAQAYLDAIRAGGTTASATTAASRTGVDWINSSAADAFRPTMSWMKDASPEDFAAARTELIRGLVHGQDGTLHENLLGRIANGSKNFSTDELDAIENTARPAFVKGRVIEDAPHLSTLQRVINYGFKKIVDPTINGLSREPQYVAAVTAEYKVLKPLVTRGEMDPYTALQLSQVRATQNMLPMIHNTLLKSQAHDVFRNYMPFYFAQEQAYKRYGRLFLRHPEMFREVQLAQHGLHSTAFTSKDDQGNEYVSMPGDSFTIGLLSKGLDSLGLGGGAMAGIPGSLSGNLDSLRTVFPEGNLPGVSPLVSIPAKQVEAWFPESRELIAPAIGPVAEGQSAWDAILPSATLKRLVQAGRGDGRSFNSAFMYAIQAAARRGEFDDETQDPRKIQDKIDRIKNTTRIMFLVKALYGAVSPVNPKLDVGDVGLRDDLRAEIKAAGGNPGLGIQRFLDKHPDASPMTVFQTMSPSGASLPATTAAGQWLTDHPDFVKGNQYAAAYLIPQGGKGNFDPQAYQEQLAVGMRQRRAPGDFVRELYLAGDKKSYFDSLKDYQAQKAAVGNNRFALNQLQQQWGVYQQEFFAAHPMFQQWLANPHTEAVQAYNQISDTLKNGTAPAGRQTELVADMRASFQDYVGQMAALKAAAGNRRTNVIENQIKALRQQWQDFMDSEEARVPELSAVINGVFKHLPDPAGEGVYA